MFKLTGKYSAPVLNLNKYKTALEKEAREILGKCMFQYVVTFQSIVPVWSGASQATLTKLASIISLPLAIRPTTTKFDRLGQGESRGGATLTFANGAYGFRFETDLPHLIFNEYQNANQGGDPAVFHRLLQPGPYDFQGKTNKVVGDELSEFQPPDLNESLRVKRVR